MGLCREVYTGTFDILSIPPATMISWGAFKKLETFRAVQVVVLAFVSLRRTRGTHYVSGAPLFY